MNAEEVELQPMNAEEVELQPMNVAYEEIQGIHTEESDGNVESHYLLGRRQSNDNTEEVTLFATN